MKPKLLLLTLLIGGISFAQGPSDYAHRYEFNNTLNNTQGSNPLSGATANPSYLNDRFNNQQDALNPNANRLESNVLNNVSDVSISFWIKAPASTTAGDIVSLKNSDTNNQGRMILSKDNNHRLIATFTSRNANP